MSTNDDDDDDDDAPPSTSRLNARIGNHRRYRKLSRTAFLRRRLQRQIEVGEAIGQVVQFHGLTDEFRQQFICLYWTEIAGDLIASKTFPIGLSNGVLQIEAISSSWLHEMQYRKANLLTRINTAIGGNCIWLGSPTLVTDVRFRLALRSRHPVVEREVVSRIRAAQHRKSRPRAEVQPPEVPDLLCALIRQEASVIEDPEVRAMVESIRTKWGR